MAETYKYWEHFGKIDGRLGLLKIEQARKEDDFTLDLSDNGCICSRCDESGLDE